MTTIPDYYVSYTVTTPNEADGVTTRRMVVELGIQTNAHEVDNRATWLAGQWLPTWARGFTILKIVHTDYHGEIVSDTPTGYGKVVVEYRDRCLSMSGRHTWKGHGLDVLNHGLYVIDRCALCAIERHTRYAGRKRRAGSTRKASNT